MKGFKINRIFPNVDPGTISFGTVLSDFHEGIMITDTDGVILFMNDAQARIDDLNIDYAIGRKVTDLYRVDEGLSPTMACLKSETAVKNLACYYHTYLGRVVNSIHNICPITSGGRLIGTICYITDYRNVEHIFDTVMKSTPPRNVPTYGISQPVDAAKPEKNGTRFTFNDIVGRGSLWGGAAIAFPFIFAMELIRSSLSNLPGLNLLLILVMIYYPGGFAEFFDTYIRQPKNKLMNYFLNGVRAAT